MTKIDANATNPVVANMYAALSAIEQFPVAAQCVGPMALYAPIAAP